MVHGARPAATCCRGEFWKTAVAADAYRTWQLGLARRARTASGNASQRFGLAGGGSAPGDAHTKRWARAIEGLIVAALALIALHSRGRKHFAQPGPEVGDFLHAHRVRHGVFMP